MTFLPSGVLKNNLPRPWSKAIGDPPSFLDYDQGIANEAPRCRQRDLKICWSNTLEKARLG